MGWCGSSSTVEDVDDTPVRDPNIVAICDRRQTFRVTSLGRNTDHDRRQDLSIAPTWAFSDQDIITVMQQAAVTERVCVILIDMYYAKNANEQYGDRTVGTAQAAVLTEAVQLGLDVFEVTGTNLDTQGAIRLPIAAYNHRRLVRKVANNMFSGTPSISTAGGPSANRALRGDFDGTYDVAVVMGFDADTCVKAAMFCTPGLLNFGIDVISAREVLATGGGDVNDVNYYGPIAL